MSVRESDVQGVTEIFKKKVKNKNAFIKKKSL